MTTPHILILGAGITSLTTALGLQKLLSSAAPKPKITILEIRSGPSTLGGAVNLTPKALRYLDYLGVYEPLSAYGAECRTIGLYDLYTGSHYAEVNFRGQGEQGIGKGDRKFFARRVMRKEIQQVLLEACAKLEGIEVLFGKNTVEMHENDDGVEVKFDDGKTLRGDFLLGCDGIHSVARSLLVEPDRKPRYTGVAAAMATMEIPNPESVKVKWETTALVTSRKGSLMASYFEPSRSKQYIGAVMEVEGVDDREGWKIRGAAQKPLKDDIRARFCNSAMPELDELIEDAQEWSLYPVYALPAQGRWISREGKCLLMGDAAHAMPPQGESTGICIEDGIAFCMAFKAHHQDIKAVFTAYEGLRQEPAEAAHRQATMRWENVKDCGWFAYKMRVWLTPWILWWTAAARESEFATDLIEEGVFEAK